MEPHKYTLEVHVHMTVQFVDSLPKRGSGVRKSREIEITDAHRSLAALAKQNPNKWARVAQRVGRPADAGAYRALDLRVELRTVDFEEVEVKGKMTRRRLFDVWVGYIVPVAVDGTAPTNGAATVQMNRRAAGTNPRALGTNPRAQR